jgi:hypothetical protein
MRLSTAVAVAASALVNAAPVADPEPEPQWGSTSSLGGQSSNPWNREPPSRGK